MLFIDFITCSLSHETDSHLKKQRKQFISVRKIKHLLKMTLVAHIRTILNQNCILILHFNETETNLPFKYKTINSTKEKCQLPVGPKTTIFFVLFYSCVTKTNIFLKQFKAISYVG